MNAGPRWISAPPQLLQTPRGELLQAIYDADMVNRYDPDPENTAILQALISAKTAIEPVVPLRSPPGKTWLAHALQPEKGRGNGITCGEGEADAFVSSLPGRADHYGGRPERKQASPCLVGRGAGAQGNGPQSPQSQGWYRTAGGPTGMVRLQRPATNRPRRSSLRKYDIAITPFMEPKRRKRAIG